jgi:hypothetical protein
MSGVGSDIGKKLGLKGATAKIAGDALMGGAAGEATGVGFGAGATGQAMSSLMQNPMQQAERKLTDIGRGIFKPGEGEFDVTPGMEGVGAPQPEDAFGFTGYGPDAVGPISAPQEGYYLGPGQSPAGPGTSVFGTALPEAAADPSMWGKATGWMKEHPWLTAGGALGIAGMAGAFGSRDEGPPDFSADLPPGFMDDLETLPYNRQQMSPDSYLDYGQVGAEQEGEFSFFNPNAIPSTSPTAGGPGATGGPGGYGGYGGNVRRATLQAQGWTFDPSTNMMHPPPGYNTSPVPAALGGLIQKYQTGGHVRGPGTGRSDDIPAVLSDGEYVIDSESVALLGDGSTDAGARRLDEMRENLRKHKSKKLAKGGFSDAAKKPERYMQEGGYVPPKENPYKEGTARYRLWNKKYGDYWEKKEKKPTKKPEKESLLERLARLKSKSADELEKLKEAKGGAIKAKPALKDLTRLAKKLETAITTGNKKRVREITAQLDSMDPEFKLARGGLVTKKFIRRG